MSVAGKIGTLTPKISFRVIEIPMNVNLVLASLEPRYFSFHSNDTLDKDLTKSTFSQTRYTDSVLASLEPRRFHSKKKNSSN